MEADDDIILRLLYTSSWIEYVSF